MHWLTIATALFYSGILAFLVLGRGWELTHAAALVLGLACAVVLAIVAAVTLMVPTADRKSFWGGFRTSIRTELRGLMALLRLR